ncbi:unknown protein [Seminavis robusta]|uniref:CRAL-TRIO domain-containing protein n=1 Tax=Seminavis robusta TaxID=568900 RepID=A0A9N8EE98_9STRA|nr:unknown protein [Seminavis robusta]|eukprot:Sro813_g206100.1 n/a (319) ;mRNA; r:4940-5896
METNSSNLAPLNPAVNDGAHIHMNNSDEDDRGQPGGENSMEPVPLHGSVLENVQFGMRLGNDVTERVWNLKYAIREEGLTPPSAFELVQIVLCGENREDNLEKVRWFHHFRAAHDIEESVESGLSCVKDAMKLFPGFFLSFHVVTMEGREEFTLAMDASMLNARRFFEENGRKLLLRALYFCLNALNPNFLAIENGPLILVECESFNWMNFTVGAHRQLQTELFSHYPTRVNQARHYNTGLFANMLWSMGRPFFPKKQRNKFQMGCKTGVGNLNEFFLKPTVEIANQRFLEALAVALEQRYYFASVFELPSDTRQQNH